MMPGPPPGPGLFGASAQAMGFGAAPGQMYGTMGMGMQQGAMGAGGAAVNTMANLAFPAAVGTVGFGAWALAPMMQRAGIGGAAGAVGFGAMRALDPFTWAAPFWRGGFGVGRGMLGVTGRGFAGTVASTVRAQGMLRGGAALAGAGTLGLAGAALPIAGGMLATEAVLKMGREAWGGAQDTMAGQALLSQIGPSIAPGQRMTRSQGAGVGSMLRGMSDELGVGVDDVSAIAKEMNSMKLFQTTKSVDEFKTRFRDMLDVVKDVAKTLQTSLDDAVGVMGELRQQGFYSAGDIQGQAARMQARSASTGISTSTYNALGRAGSQYARSRGMRGRFGSEAFQQSTEAVSYAVRHGMMDENEVMEMGGVESVGARLAAKQMDFLRTSRGRVMIANAYGRGAQGLGGILNPNVTTESLVTGAAGRGLGVLRAAGSREAREDFMPYAGMAMVSMAASQQRQLYGGVSERGVIGMLGTMGLGREEAKMLMQQTMAMPQALAERRQQEFAADQKRAYEDIRRHYSVGSRWDRLMDRTGLGGMWDSSRDWGAAAYASYGQGYQNLMEGITGRREYVAGGAEHLRSAREYARSGRIVSLTGEVSGREGGWLMPSERDRARSLYRPYLIGEHLGRGLSAKGKDVIQLGKGVAIRTQDMERAQSVLETGFKPGSAPSASAVLRLSQKQQAKLRDLSMRGDLDDVGDLERSDDRWGRGNLSNEEQNAFLMAREIGVLGEDASMASFAASKDERLRVLGVMQRGLAEEDRRRGTDLRKLVSGDSTPISAGAMTLSELRDRSDAAVKDLLTTAGTSELFGVNIDRGGLLGKFVEATGIWTGDRLSDAGDALKGSVENDPKARAALARYMRAWAEQATDKNGFNAGAVEELEQLEKVLGAESPAFRELQHIHKKMTSDPDVRSRAVAKARQEGGMLDIFGALPFEERRQQQISAENSRIRGAMGKLRLSDEMEARAKKLLNSPTGPSEGSRQARAAARMGLFDEALKTQGTIDAGEQETLQALLGDGAGAMSTGINRLMSGKSEYELGEFLEKRIGMTGDDKSAALERLLKTKSGSGARADEVMSLIKEMRLENPELWGSGGAEVAGVEGATGQGLTTAYVEANTRFVTTVERFVSAMKEANIDGLDLSDLEFKGASPK